MKVNVIRHLNSFKICWEANCGWFNKKRQKRIKKLIYKIEKEVNK